MLTDTVIKRAKLPEKGIKKLYDAKGLYLALTAKGARLWRMKFSLGCKEQMLSFGPYPEVTLAQARDLRDAARESLRAGVVPAGRRRLAAAKAPQEHPPAFTFEQAARHWHATMRPRWKPGHADDVLDSLVADVFPAIGALAVDGITSPQVLAVVRAIETRSVDIARRVRQRISAVFCHAIAEGTAIADPAAPIVKALAPHIKGHRPAIIDLAPARAMLQAVEAVPAHPTTKLAHRLLALTAVRPGELRGARWAEFEGLDGRAPIWRIPAARMKMKREHLVPLSPLAVAAIRAAGELSGDLPIVFPSTRSPRIPISENAMGYFLNRAGYQDKHVPHGWRATFSSVMNERHRADRAVIELMLAHMPSDQVEAAYNRALHLDRRRELAEEWAVLITEGAVPTDALLGGARRSPSPAWTTP